MRGGIVLALFVCAGCRTASVNPGDLTFLTRAGCVQTDEMRSHLDEALKAKGLPTSYAVVDLDKLPASDARRGYPTPTLLYKGADMFGMPAPTPPFPEPT